MADDPPPPKEPEDERLDPLRAAFEAGDYVLVRRLAEELGRDGDLADAAEAYRRRTLVDPVHLTVIAACLALFLLIAYKYVL